MALRITSHCDKCGKEQVFTSIWAGDGFVDSKGHRKVFEPASKPCRKCGADIEFDAASCKFVTGDQTSVEYPYDLCNDCDE